MIATPAVDLRGGRCVQLVGGRPEEERVSLPDPDAIAASWAERGFESLHVVDLDAALGTGDNEDEVERVLLRWSEATGSESAEPGPCAGVQVGGGIRDDHRAEALLDAGADRIVVGTRGVEDPGWLAALAMRRPGRVLLALDTRGGIVLRKGWTEATELHVERFLPKLAGLPLAGVLSTDVGREGRMEGIDLAACRSVIEASPHPVWISGGVTSIDDLAHLEDAGAHGVVLGMALYTGRLDSQAVAARWGTDSDRETKR